MSSGFENLDCSYFNMNVALSICLAALGDVSLPCHGIFASGVHLAPITEIARAFTDELGEHVPEAVKAFASLGSFGDNQSNAERDIHRWTADIFDTSIDKYYLISYCLSCPWWAIPVPYITLRTNRVYFIHRKNAMYLSAFMLTVLFLFCCSSSVLELINVTFSTC